MLQHLARVYVSRYHGQGKWHPNVLGIVDAWEEDEALFIRTELCALGSFSRFLWEFGRRFERLDEGRVWKIAADLSSVRPVSRFVSLYALLPFLPLHLFSIGFVMRVHLSPRRSSVPPEMAL